jgi:hypothetical protein
MKLARVAAVALVAIASSVGAQIVAPALPGDISIARPIAGNWSYVAITGGSEATFVDGAARVQITIRCTRVTRRITIAKPASAATPFLSVWTSSGNRNLPALFNPPTARLSVDVPAFDPLLDAITFSRGRVGFATAGAPALVVPAWAELSRVVEDCRT